MSILKDLQDIFQTFSAALGQTWFVVLPWLLYFLFKPIWMDFIVGKYAGSIQYVLLEIIPPREIEKSPKLMESFFAGFAGVHTTYNTTDEYCKGMVLPKLSLEIVSDGGNVHFYFYVQKNFRNLVESNLYAQYPDSQILEVNDYTLSVPKMVPNKDWDLWGADLDFTKPDIYPIKTYNKFEEDVTGKMIDPLSAMIEALGRVGPEQKLWFQIIITPLGDKDTLAEGLDLVKVVTGKKKKAKGPFEKVWVDITDVFSNIFGAMMASEVAFTEEKKDAVEQPIEFKLTPGEKDVLKALEENIGRSFFKTKMRFMYLGKKNGFDKSNVSSFMGSIKQFNDNNLNSLKPNAASKTFANFVAVKSRMRFRQIKLFKRYVGRSMDGLNLKLSTAELATIFHMPDMSVVAPGVSRVDAKRGGAPSNLPIE
jgi:hypothetical protein